MKRDAGYFIFSVNVRLSKTVLSIWILQRSTVCSSKRRWLDKRKALIKLLVLCGLSREPTGWWSPSLFSWYAHL